MEAGASLPFCFWLRSYGQATKSEFLTNGNRQAHKTRLTLATAACKIINEYSNESYFRGMYINKMREGF